MAPVDTLELIRYKHGVLTVTWSRTDPDAVPVPGSQSSNHSDVAPFVEIKAQIHWVDATTRTLLHTQRTTITHPNGTKTLRTTLTHYPLPPPAYRWPAPAYITEISSSPAITTHEWLRHHWQGLNAVWEELGRPETRLRFYNDEIMYILEQLDRLQGQIAEIRNAARAAEEAGEGLDGNGPPSGVDCLDGSG